MKNLKVFLAGISFCVGLVLVGGCGQQAVRRPQSAAELPGPAVKTAADAPSKKAEPAPVELTTMAQRTGYSIGYQMAGWVTRGSADALDAEGFVCGVKDRLSGAEPALSEGEMESLGDQFRRNRRRGRGRRGPVDIQSNQKLAAQFLAENQEKEGVVTLPSGLQYRVIEAGEGPAPEPGGRVVLQYTAKVAGGEQFDSSRERGGPVTVRLASTLAAWREAIPLMKRGAKWELFVPPGLGYGARGCGDAVEPYQALVFEIELIDVL